MTEPFSWHDYKPTWRSYAHKVDLVPVVGTCELRVEERIDGRNLDQKTIDRIRTDVASQVATALLVGGTADGRHGVRLRSGGYLEASCSSKWWPFNKFAPTIMVGDRHQPRHDMVLCVCQPHFPFIYEQVWVVGWADLEGWKNSAEKTDWGWRIKQLEPMATITGDELANPRLPIGTAHRRYVGDGGIPEYIESYFGEAASS